MGVTELRTAFGRGSLLKTKKMKRRKVSFYIDCRLASVRLSRGTDLHIERLATARGETKSPVACSTKKLRGRFFVGPLTAPLIVNSEALSCRRRFFEDVGKAAFFRWQKTPRETFLIGFENAGTRVGGWMCVGGCGCGWVVGWVGGWVGE